MKFFVASVIKSTWKKSQYYQSKGGDRTLIRFTWHWNDPIHLGLRSSSPSNRRQIELTTGQCILSNHKLELHSFFFNNLFIELFLSNITNLTIWLLRTSFIKSLLGFFYVQFYITIRPTRYTLHFLVMHFT